MAQDIRASEARRIALAAQGLAGARAPRSVTRRALRRLTAGLGAIQLDSVNVVVRAHYLPAFSRLGAYPTIWLDEEAWGKTPTLFEYWGHVASLMPLALQPLFRWRMQRLHERDRGAWAAFARPNMQYIQAVLAEIERRGPVTGGDFAEGPRQAGWWNWSRGKHALEWLFAVGLIATRTRRGFERVYDLTERVIPRTVLEQPTPLEADAQRELVRIAARAMGIATEGDLRDYFRMPVADTRARITELVEEGELRSVAVEGWRQRGFLARGAMTPRQTQACALLSPFDNLIWRRERTERLFGVRIRLEVYTPAQKREHGYYVLPFLMRDRVVARVDLKADRPAGRLLVQAAHLEPGADAALVVPRLAAELEEFAAWIRLSEVQLVRSGGFARLLRRALG
jgi:uncharacterized protein